MKFKILCITILIITFFISAVPSDSKKIEIGKVIPALNIQSQEINAKLNSNKKLLIINFWSPKDPASRVRSHFLDKFVKENKDSDIEYLNICIDETSFINKEILAIDNINNSIYLPQNSIDFKEIYKTFQLKSGLRCFVLDSEHRFLSIMPDLDNLQNLL